MSSAFASTFKGKNRYNFRIKAYVRNNQYEKNRNHNRYFFKDLACSKLSIKFNLINCQKYRMKKKKTEVLDVEFHATEVFDVDEKSSVQVYFSNLNPNDVGFNDMAYIKWGKRKLEKKREIWIKDVSKKKLFVRFPTKKNALLTFKTTRANNL